MPVHGVDLHERVDQLLADAAALLGGIERGGSVGDDHLALYALHHVEGAADHRLVVAHGEHLRHARGRGLQALEQSRLAQHVVGAGGQRGARGAAQDELGAVGFDAR